MIKKVFSYGIFSLVSSVIGFITSIYLAKLLTPEELGMVGIFQSFTFLAIPFVSFSSLGLVSVNKATLLRYQYRIFTNSYITLGFFLSLIGFIFLLFLGIVYPDYIFMLFCVGIVAILKLLNDLHAVELVQMHKTYKYGITNLSEVIIGLVLTIIFISYVNLSWEGRILAITVSLLFSLLFRYINGYSTLKFYSVNFKTSDFKQIIHFGLPLIVGIGAGWIHHNAGKFILLEHSSLHNVGLLTFALSLGILVNIINTSIVNSIIPTLYKGLKDKNVKKILIKYLKYYILCIFPILVLIGYSMKWFVPFVFGKHYIDSIELVLWIFIANAIGGLYNIVGLVLNYFKKTKIQTIIYYISSILGVVITLLVVEKLGIISIAIGLVTTYFFLFILTLYYGWDMLNKKGVE